MAPAVINTRRDVLNDIRLPSVRLGRLELGPLDSLALIGEGEASEEDVADIDRGTSQPLPPRGATMPASSIIRCYELNFNLTIAADGNSTTSH